MPGGTPGARIKGKHTQRIPCPIGQGSLPGSEARSYTLRGHVGPGRVGGSLGEKKIGRLEGPSRTGGAGKEQRAFA